MNVMPKKAISGLKEVRTLDVRPADVRTATIDLRDVRTAGC